MEKSEDYSKPIEDAKIAYEIVESAEDFLHEAWAVSGKYRTVTESFLNADNVESNEELLNFYEDEFGKEIDFVSVRHDELHTYSMRVSETIEHQKYLFSLLDSIDFESLSENKVVDGRTLDLNSFSSRVEAIMEEYDEVERSIWSTDYRLKRSEKTNHNLIDIRIKEARKEFMLSEERDEEDVRAALSSIFPKTT